MVYLGSTIGSFFSLFAAGIYCTQMPMYFQLTPVFLCPFIEFDHFPCCHSEIHWHYCNKYASRMEKAHAKLRLKAENVSFEAQEAYKGSCRAHTTAC